jgi:hypothetical protein
MRHTVDDMVASAWRARRAADDSQHDKHEGPDQQEDA